MNMNLIHLVKFLNFIVLDKYKFIILKLYCTR